MSIKLELLVGDTVSATEVLHPDEVVNFMASSGVLVAAFGEQKEVLGALVTGSVFLFDPDTKERSSGKDFNGVKLANHTMFGQPLLAGQELKFPLNPLTEVKIGIAGDETTEAEFYDSMGPMAIPAFVRLTGLSEVA